MKSLGCYDEVVTYEDVNSMPADQPVAYVDMAGNSPLRATLHQHFGEQMKYSGIIGLTHRKSSPGEAAQALAGGGAKPQFFFAPDHIRKRAKEWRPGGFDMRFGAAWAGFTPRLDRWIGVREHRGPAAVQHAYLDTLNGRVPPDQGLILSLSE